MTEATANSRNAASTIYNHASVGSGVKNTGLHAKASRFAKSSGDINTQKVYLAKLLSTENIVVTHDPSASTAAFNPVTRTLILPTFKEDLALSTYNLFVGHEVGHALFTPPNWTDLAEDAIRKHPSLSPNLGLPQFHTIINLVEDARIERRILVTYPGLRRHFIAGYHDLVFNKNGFRIGIPGTVDFHKLGFLDRFNVYFKSRGMFGDIPFSDEEQILVDRTASLWNSFSGVMSVAIDIFLFLKKKEEEEEKESADDEAGENSGLDGDSSSEASSNDEDGGSSSSGTPDENDDDRSDGAESGKEEGSNDGSLDTDDSGSAASENDDSDGDDDNDSGICETQNSLDSAVGREVDEEGLATVDLFVPSVKKPVEYIVPHTEVAPHFANMNAGIDIRKDCAGKIRSRNFSKVAFLANEFNRKQAAANYKKAATASTGTLDTTRLHAYKYRDDIFKRITIEPDGRSHGMIMFVDWSGSMGPVLADVVEQVLTLVLFCKRVGIPYRVYAFSDGYAKRPDASLWKNRNLSGAQSTKVNELEIAQKLSLLELLSSKMSAMAFNKMYEALSVIAIKGSHWLPHGMHLHYTPLNAAILAAHGVVPKIQSEDGYEICNVIFLTDGSDYTHSGNRSYDSDGIAMEHRGSYSYNRKLSASNQERKFRIRLKNSRTGFEWVVSNIGRYSVLLDTNFLTNALLDSLRKETNCNLVGMFLISKSSVTRKRGKYIIEGEFHRAKFRENVDAAQKILRANNYYEIRNHVSYDAYFIIACDDRGVVSKSNTITKIVASDDSVRKKITAISKNFIADRNNIRAERAILSRFIDVISKHV